MTRKARVRLRFIGNTPQLVAASPYYTLIEFIQIGIGILGVFAIGIGAEAVLTQDELFTPLFGEGIVCLLIYSGVEFTLVRAESLEGRLSIPGADIFKMVCQVGHHTYHPEGVTTQDRFGIPSQKHSPQMVWKCTRCGKECWLEPGVSPK